MTSHLSDTGVGGDILIVHQTAAIIWLLFPTQPTLVR